MKLSCRLAVLEPAQETFDFVAVGGSRHGLSPYLHCHTGRPILRWEDYAKSNSLKKEALPMLKFPNDGDHAVELEGKHCDACGEWLEPGREWCPSCGMDR